MKIYCEVGASAAVVDSSSNPECPTGFIEMQQAQPSMFHIADADGCWVYSYELELSYVKNLRKAAMEHEAIALKNEADIEAIMQDTEPDYTLFKQKVAEINQRYPLPIEA